MSVHGILVHTSTNSTTVRSTATLRIDFLGTFGIQYTTRYCWCLMY